MSSGKRNHRLNDFEEDFDLARDIMNVPQDDGDLDQIEL